MSPQHTSHVLILIVTHKKKIKIHLQQDKLHHYNTTDLKKTSSPSSFYKI